MSGNFVDCREILERTWKVRKKIREFENRWLWQAVFRKFILIKRGKDVSHDIV